MNIATLCAPLLGALAAAPLAAQDDDYFISAPAGGGIYRLDAETGALTPFALGFEIPFYGVWATDGNLYIPDQDLGAVFKIDSAGVIKPFAAGGFLSTPVTVAQGPGGDIFVSDLFTGVIVRVEPDGTQHLVADQAASNGVIDGPGGIGFDLDGILYISNNINATIAAVDPDTGDTWLVSDGGGLLNQPGGVALDGGGNLFVTNYATNRIVRIDVATGEAEIFIDDPSIVSPNDIKLSRKGRLLVTTKNSKLIELDPTGAMNVIAQDQTIGPWDGVAVMTDHPPCTGRFLAYGTGTPGAGDITPSLGGIFSPCAGATAALEFEGFNGGALGSLFYGIAPGAIPFKDGTLLVDVTAPFGQIPLVFPGVGAGNGEVTLTFTYPDDASLAGVSLYVQALAADPAAPRGISMSNGLEERIGF